MKNTYAAVTSIDSCNAEVTIDTTAGFTAGEKILIIQMKGATIDETNSSSFGNIKNVNGAGNFEYAYIGSVSGSKIYLKNALLKSYDVSSGVQIVDVLQYFSMYLSGKYKAAKSWNGKKGGVLAPPRFNGYDMVGTGKYRRFWSGLLGWCKNRMKKISIAIKRIIIFIHFQIGQEGLRVREL